MKKTCRGNRPRCPPAKFHANLTKAVEMNRFPRSLFFTYTWLYISLIRSLIKNVSDDLTRKAFRRVQLLRIHLKIHIGDKKHKCSYCSKGFVDRKNLISHERIHTGEKPYVCEACGKDFNQRSALNVHRRSQHNELIAIKNKSEVTATGGSTLTFDELNGGLISRLTL